MKEAQCICDNAFSFYKARTKGWNINEAGSIETLIRIVDENGGFTITKTLLHFMPDGMMEERIVK